MRRALAVALPFFMAHLAQAGEAPPAPMALAHGFLVATSKATSPDDLRPGRIAAGFAEAGLESFVASDCVRPPPDPERALVHARWRLDDARRARRAQRWDAAAAAGDEAIQVIERNAFERQHLALLVEALIERGATALGAKDPGTAETVFLKALALDPLYELDGDLYGGEVTSTFSEVRRASRELRFGSMRVEVPRVPNAIVSVDFGSPQDAPALLNLPDGRHFVSVSAPSRHEVVSLLPVHAGRDTLVTIRPPLSGDARDRATALTDFDPVRPASIIALARAAGLRFVLITDASGSGVHLTLVDGESGQVVPKGEVMLSAEPSHDEVAASVTRIAEAATLVAPDLAPKEDGGPRWYTRWWVIGLLGVAVAGAATATYFVASSKATTLYTFEP